jgi:hypothetical protein
MASGMTSLQGLENKVKISSDAIMKKTSAAAMETSTASAYDQLIDVLVLYHENHLYYWRCLFDYFGHYDRIIKKKLQDKEYVAKMCLDIVMITCYGDVETWNKLLRKHRYDKPNNSCGILSLILSHVRKLNSSDEDMHFMLQNAVNLTKDNNLYSKIRPRIVTLQQYGCA